MNTRLTPRTPNKNPVVLTGGIVFILGACVLLGAAFAAAGFQWRERQRYTENKLNQQLTQASFDKTATLSAAVQETLNASNITPTMIAQIVADTPAPALPSATSFQSFPTLGDTDLLNTPAFALPSLTGASPTLSPAASGGTPVIAIGTGFPTLNPNGSPTVNVPAFLAQTATAAAGGGATRTPLPTLRPSDGTAASAPTALLPRTVDPNAPTFTPSQTLTITPSATPSPVPATPTSRWEMGAPAGSGNPPAWDVKLVFTPEPASGASKLGLDVKQPSGVVEFSDAYHPAVVVAVNDLGFLKDVKARSPQTITVGRVVVPQPMGGDAAQVARDFVANLLGTYQANAGYVDYWQGYDEPSVEQIEWYAQFEATRACEMQAKGFKAAIGGFGPGQPEPAQFEKFLPAIEAGLRCGAVLLLHESAGPNLWLWWQQAPPGLPWYPDRGPLIGRYRYFYRDLLIPRDKVIPLILANVQINAGIGAGLRSGPSDGGWRAVMGYWQSVGVANDANSYYLDQLKWFDSLLKRDQYVLGGAIASCCQTGDSYDLKELLPDLGNYIRK